MRTYITTYIYNYIPGTYKPLVRIAALDCSSVQVLILLEVRRLYSSTTHYTVRRSCRVRSKLNRLFVAYARLWRYMVRTGVRCGGGCTVLIPFDYSLAVAVYTSYGTCLFGYDVVGH